MGPPNRIVMQITQHFCTVFLCIMLTDRQAQLKAARDAIAKLQPDPMVLTGATTRRRRLTKADKAKAAKAKEEAKKKAAEAAATTVRRSKRLMEKEAAAAKKAAKE